VTDRKRIQQERQDSLQALQRLYAISADRERDLDAKVEAILDVGREYLDLPNGFLTRIENGMQVVETAVATHPGLQPGESCPLDEAYCKRTVELDQLLAVVNAADEGWSDDPAYDRFELGTYIGGRVTVDDELHGTLCFADVETRDRRFTDTQRTFVELLTRWVSYELERRQAEAQLQRERDRLDEFAGIVSHDLRTPLATANSRAQLLAEEVESDHVRPMIRSLDRMADLLDDLLALARAGKLVEETIRVSLQSVTETAWRTVDADGSLAVRCGDVQVRASESRLQQLFENLFRNSVEHGSTSPGPDGGEHPETGDATVTVTVGLLDDRRGFYVADDGPGIPAAERDRVFEAGYTTTEAGTGFGLNIVEQIATAHDWTVRVTESDSGGARFEFSGVALEAA
jgi:signal transduction histidine kinase